MFKTAVILAGGEGSRLKDVTKKPKPLIHINGKPHILNVINHIFLWNFSKIIILVRKDQSEIYRIHLQKLCKEVRKKLTIEINGIKIALLICEDIWDKTTISESLSSPSPEICITLNASPFEIGKKNIRSEILKKAAKKYKTNFIYLNIIGGQDEIVFDGSSLIYDKSSQKLMHMDSFKESILTLNYAKKFKVSKNISIIDNKKKQISDIYEAIKLGTKDYILKNNFEGVIIGLSGGIDSALTLAIASDILSKDKILPVLMPSIYTSSLSNKLAREQCAMLGITPYEIPIIDINKSVKYVISENFLPINNNIAAENIQSRIRGLLLMTLSNETGKVVLSTGNKSELAVGYSTLYGDMSGSFSPLKDLYKTDIYKLSIYRNSFKKAIPEKILKREPSAELNFNQKDLILKNFKSHTAIEIFI